MKRWLLLFAGFLSLATGVVGIFLPILPTTPFILLSAACFLKSSKPLYNWITQHHLFGPYISNYLRYGAVTTKSKIVSIALLWAIMLTTIIFMIDALWLRLLLILIAIAVTIHLVLLKKLTKDMLKTSEQESSP